MHLGVIYMKTYLEVQKKQEEYKNKLIKLRNEENPDKKLLAIYSQWIDILAELQITNIVQYAKKIGYDFNTDEEMFELTDDARKEMFITEEQAKNNLESYRINYKYAPNKTSKFFGSINTDKVNIEILEWLLEY